MIDKKQIVVIKRDGAYIDFDEIKIKNAITAANEALDDNCKKLSSEEIDATVQKIVEVILTENNDEKSEKDKIIQKYPYENGKMSIYIEDIQDLVQNTLIASNYFDIATSYIAYRFERTRIRESRSDFRKEVDILLNPKSYEETDKENANVDDLSYGGQAGAVNNLLWKRLGLDFVSEKHRYNHLNNYIYIHDITALRVGMPNCLSIPFDDALNNPVKYRNTDVRPSHHLSTTFQMYPVDFQSQSLQQFGGVAATHIDTSTIKSFRYSFNSHYKEVQDILPFIKVNKKLNESKSILDKQYVGGIFSFIKKYIYSKALKLTKKELFQGVEGFYHNLNTLMSRSGNQLPFTSINYGRDTSFEGRLINEALIDGSLKGVGTLHRTSIFPCGIFQYKKGVNDKPGTSNYYLKKKAISSTVRRFYPNYVNCDWSVQTDGIIKDRELKNRVIKSWLENKKDKYNQLCDLIDKNPEIGRLLSLYIIKNKDKISLSVNMDPKNQTELEIASTMGCRTYNGFDINFDEEYFDKLLEETLKQGKLPINYLYSAMQKDGRGNICPNTIILPTIAMESKIEYEKSDKKIDLIDIFMKRLEGFIEDAKDQLIERFNHIASKNADCAKYTYENNFMKGYIPEEGIRSALKHGTLAIGQIGLAETLQILIGCDHTTDKGMDLAIKIEKLFNKKCAEYKTKYKLNFGVYYSPAENLCFTSYKKFVKKYGLIENVTAYKNEKGELVPREYFTNSIHVPVWTKIDPFKKIEIEAKLSGFSNAGCICYVELTNAKYNEKVVEQIIDFAMEKDIPYLAINISLDNCLDCGYVDEDAVFSSNGNKCPCCGSSNIQKPRRITGYLGYDVRYTFNFGKQHEEHDREDNSQYINVNNMKGIMNIKWKKLV